MIFNKENILKTLNKYNFDSQNYIVISGAALVLQNVKEYTSDIDITVSNELYNQLLKKYSCTFEKEIENYATMISGAFLFPKVDAIRELGIRRKFISKDMILVAVEYGISMMLLAKRAELLNIVSSFSAKDFYVKASKLGWRKNEPSRIKEVEKPILFEQLVYRAINENEISIQRGAELLKMPYKKVEENCLFDER